MKTLEQINQLISDERAAYDALPNKPGTGLFDDPIKDIKKRDQTKYHDRIEFLECAWNYLQLNLDEQDLKEKAESLRLKIAEISSRKVPVTFYPANLSGNHSEYFNKRMGIDKMHEQIKLIEFILC